MPNAAIILTVAFGVAGLFMARLAWRGDRHTLTAVMENMAVTNLSEWTEPNEDHLYNEPEYHKVALANIAILAPKMKEAILFEKTS